MTKKEKKTIIGVKEQYTEKFLNKKNVIGVGVGNKITKGQVTPTKAIMVLVEKKEKGMSALSRKDQIPNLIEDIPTDVYETGKITIPLSQLPQKENFLSRNFRKLFKRQSNASANPTDRWRPIPGGVSIANEYVTSGTYSWKARDLDTGRIVGYTNAHVGVSDLLKDYKYHKSRKILQPGPHFGGKLPKDLCGEGASFVKLNKESNNWVDGMIFYPSSEDMLADRICEIGVPSKVGNTAEAGLSIKKYGTTTKLTTGSLVSTNATIRVGYHGIGVLTFMEQLVGTRMSAGGDSGSSLFVNGKQGDHLNNELIGVLFAGGGKSTIFNPIWNFIRPLDIVPLTTGDIGNGGGNNGGSGEEIQISFQLQKDGKPAIVDVTDKIYGTPIQGARIIIDGELDTYNGVSDNNGQMKIDTIRAGSYTGTCSKPGYMSATQKIRVE